MKVDLYTKTGTKSGQLEIAKKIFGADVNDILLAQARRVYLSNHRRAKPKSKTRGEVNGSGKKIWRQKGTGRARHGDRYANIFVGGGVAHGPTGTENFSLKMSRKMRRAAMISALSQKFEAKKTLFIKGLNEIEPKTKLAAQLLGKLNLKGKKVTVITDGENRNVWQAMRNIEKTDVVPASQLNTYQVMVGGQLMVMSEALPALEKLCFGEAKKEEQIKVEK